MIKAAFEDVLNDSIAECLLRGAMCRMTVTSDSMRPLLRAGDVVVVEQWPAQRVRCGDIIVFAKQGDICSHRCIRVFDEGEKVRYLTKGDATLMADEIVAENDLIGKVSVIERGALRLRMPRMLEHIMGQMFYGVWLVYRTLCRMKQTVARYV